jgi:hypothetical protein
MIGWISRFFGRLEQNQRRRSPRRPARKWEAFLEDDLETIVMATENNGAARRLLQHRLATASDVINMAKGKSEVVAMEILTKACDAEGDNRREAMRRGAATFDDPDLATASAAETWFLVAIQHRQRQIDDNTLHRIESLIDKLRSPIQA